VAISSWRVGGLRQVSACGRSRDVDPGLSVGRHRELQDGDEGRRPLRRGFADSGDPATAEHRRGDRRWCLFRRSARSSTLSRDPVGARRRRALAYPRRDRLPRHRSQPLSDRSNRVLRDETEPPSLASVLAAVVALLAAALALAGAAALILPTHTPGARYSKVTQATISSTICVKGSTATIRPPSAYTSALKEAQLVEWHYADKNPAHYGDAVAQAGPISEALRQAESGPARESADPLSPAQKGVVPRRLAWKSESS
jgi:hypothetical protein